ncbi:hypothetical protein [Methanolobus sp.]|uniref:hypothetical protein n=1 Tax=Methanolobus sp. TaxID=1874737 RepID=UPI0025DB4F83|nr:hypothetical protein [Methanolobus sp.]
MVCESIISEGMNGSAKRGKKMKVRLEIIDEDGIESTNVEFGGKHWKRCLLAFIDSIEDENPKHTEPSSAYSHTNVPSNSVNYNAVPGPVPGTSSVYDHAAQPVMPQSSLQQQQAMQQQAFFQQQAQQQAQYQQQQSPYPQQSQYYLPPSVAPYYYFGQPAQNVSSINSQQPLHYPPVQPAAHGVMPVRQRVTGRTTSLQERMNDSSLTINERLELFLKYEYPRVWFSSQDIQQHYERIYGAIKQSTVSTYLSRMFQKALLERRGNRTQREYRYIGDEVTSPRQTVPGPTGIPQFHRNSMEYG